MGTTMFVWDPVFDYVSHELDANNDVRAVYNNEPQQYGGVLSQRRGPTSHYHHHDALGSTRFLTDSSGNVTDTYLHDAWGNSVASTGTTVNPFKWVGKYGYYTDDSTGQVYVRARMYQPKSARWGSLDPLGFEDGPNRFAYTWNQPVIFVDPSGLGCQVCSSGIRWNVPVADLDEGLLGFPYRDMFEFAMGRIRETWKLENLTTPTRTGPLKFTVNDEAFVVHFLFFMDWIVCETGKGCGLRNKELVIKQYDGEELAIREPINLKNVPKGNAWTKAPIITNSKCDTVVVYVDAPGTGVLLKPQKGKKPANVSYDLIQTVTLFDQDTDQDVDSKSIVVHLRIKTDKTFTIDYREGAPVIFE